MVGDQRRVLTEPVRAECLEGRNGSHVQEDHFLVEVIDPESGAVLERLEMPRGTGVSGIESDGANLFYCGGGSSGKVRAVRRPKGQQGEKR